MIHTVKGFGIVNKAEIGVFLELSRFFNDPADVGNLISGSSAFSKSNLNIWKFTVHILFKSDLENFEHYFASMWGECNCAVVYTYNMLKWCQLSKKRSKRWTWEISAPETDPIPLSVPCSNIWLSTTFSGKVEKKREVGGRCTSKRQIWCESSSFQLPNYLILVIIHTAFWASMEGRKEEGREVFL